MTTTVDENDLPPLAELRVSAIDRQVQVVHDMLQERRAQDAKWGEQNFDYSKWLAILSEELGEASKEWLTQEFQGIFTGNFRTELIQSAAVLVAMIECGDRNGWFHD